MAKKLSIIIPAYNAEPYIHELMELLDKQMTDEVEVFLIDDGSDKPLHINYPWLKSYRQKNLGISKARNRGLKTAKGEIIAFLDADDLVSENYISYILSRANEDWDYMDLSWKSLEDSRYLYKLNSDNDSLSNPSACTRVFKRSFIGDTRFPEKKDACEDEDFTRHLDIKNAKHVCATEYLYFYRVTVPNSNSKRYLGGLCETKRIAYYFKHVTKDMTYLIDEFKKEDETNEVFLVTYRNDIQELEKYCRIWNPNEKGPVSAMEKRGEPTNLITLRQAAKRTQVVLYASQINMVAGTSTFLYAFCKQMSKYYDIMVLYNAISNNQYFKLSKVVQVVKNDVNQPIICDTLIMNSVMDQIPKNIKYNKSVQMVHCVKQMSLHIPQDRDHIVNVSQTSKESFGKEAKNGIVIHNLTVPVEESEKCLLLVSALRVGAEDKQGNDTRCVQFAQKLNSLNIPFIWVYFGDKPIPNAAPEMLYGGVKENMRPYLEKADYLVQLSGAEAFSYSLLEALEANTPVIVTPLDMNEEMGIKDEINSYIFPFDASEWTDEMIRRIVQIPQFNYGYDNEKIIKQWRDLLGKTKPTGKYKPTNEVSVKIVQEYYDLQIKENMRPKEYRIMSLERAKELQDKGLVEITGGF